MQTSQEYFQPNIETVTLLISVTIGIYKITNITNNRFYIGASVNIEVRWRVHKHRLRTKKHANKFLLGDYQKYDKSKFKFEILEFCAREKLLIVEQTYLDKHYDNQKTCYNLAKNASAPMLGKKWSKEQRKIASEKTKGRIPSKETIEGGKKFRTGKTWEELYGKEKADQIKKKLSNSRKKLAKEKNYKEKMSKAIKDVWKRPGYKDKMKKIIKQRYENGQHHGSKKIGQYDLNGNLIAVFKNAVIASKELKGLKLLSNCMRQVATGVKKTHGGFIWKYIQ